jgi:RimJ/RimL family protein N-acetyltransferase
MWAITPKSLLTDAEQALLLEHFLSLESKDRRLRFGLAVTDDFLRHYVSMSQADEHSEIFVIFADGSIAAVCHVAVGAGEGELGFSVLPCYRGSGMTSALFARAVSYLRVHNVGTVYIHCLSENRVMQHIARKNNMSVVTEMGESDARLQVAEPTLLTVYQNNSAHRVAVYDAMMRQHIAVFRRMWGSET